MKFQELLKEYNMLTRQQRLFYPRNFKLSEKFIFALKQEMKSQDEAGITPDEFARKLIKALQFYVADYKKIKKAVAVSKVDNLPSALK
jgi:hypothetical protein